ncbi:MAG TPA: SET domain-containing protein [Saprospiraceae bacterium]|nr:SET domain-containing protein [Saprospiraceae bacterium]HQW56871.1 SET domain-containing protein [Saprospiraceae bacterium]
MLHVDELYITSIPERGRGMFCSRKILKKEIIEVCPVLVIPRHQLEQIHTSMLHDYYFLWDHGQAAIALGYGSLYNHSYTPNAEYIMDFTHSQLIIQSLCDIEVDTEITFNYNGDANDRSELWFAPQ